MKLTSLIKESIDDKAADLWNKYKGRIYNDPQVMNPKNIAVAVLTDPLWAIKWIEDWASKNDDEYEHPVKVKKNIILKKINLGKKKLMNLQISLKMIGQ